MQYVINRVVQRANLWVDADERVSLGVKLLLQGDDDGLEVLHRLVFDVVGHLEEKAEHQTCHLHHNALKSFHATLIQTFPMLVLSRAASISSRTKKGAGL